MLKDNKDYNKAEVNTISQFKKRIMKFNSFLLIGLVICICCFYLLILFDIMSGPSNSWWLLSDIISFAVVGILVSLNIPAFMHGINLLEYLKGNNNKLNSSIVYGIISLPVTSLSLYLLFVRDMFSIFGNNTSNAYMNLKTIIISLVYIVFISPVIFDLISLINIKHKFKEKV